MSLHSVLILLSTLVGLLTVLDIWLTLSGRPDIIRPTNIHAWLAFLFALMCAWLAYDVAHHNIIGIAIDVSMLAWIVMLHRRLPPRKRKRKKLRAHAKEWLDKVREVMTPSPALRPV